MASSGDGDGDGCGCGAAPPVKTPALSDCQKRLICSTWAELQCERRSKLQRVGAESFADLFEHTPAFKAAFAQLNNLNVQQMRDSALLKAHSMAVLHVLEQLVYCMDDMTKWPHIVHSLASRHQSRTNNSKLSHDVAMQCWLTIRCILAERQKLNEEVELAWLLLTRWLGEAMQICMDSMHHA